jgi:hypothetical protein
MNRRGFLALLPAPFVARFFPAPYVGIDWAPGPDYTVHTLRVLESGEYFYNYTFVTGDGIEVPASPMRGLSVRGPHDRQDRG